MMERTFAKLDELFAVMDQEMRRIFRRDGSIHAKTKHVRIVHRNGDIEITGEFKSLTINGRRVRFGEGKAGE